MCTPVVEPRPSNSWCMKPEAHNLTHFVMRSDILWVSVICRSEVLNWCMWDFCLVLLFTWNVRSHSLYFNEKKSFGLWGCGPGFLETDDRAFRHRPSDAHWNSVCAVAANTAQSLVHDNYKIILHFQDGLVYGSHTLQNLPCRHRYAFRWSKDANLMHGCSVGDW